MQSQPHEIVTDLLATSASAPGAGLVDVDAIAGALTAIDAGTLRAALVTLGGQNGATSIRPPAHTRRLPMSSTAKAFELTGSVQEIGRLGISGAGIVVRDGRHYVALLVRLLDALEP